MLLSGGCYVEPYPDDRGMRAGDLQTKKSRDLFRSRLFHEKLVPKARLELARAFTRHPLKMVCLPIPPLRQGIVFILPRSALVKSDRYFCSGAGMAGALGGMAGSVCAGGEVGVTWEGMMLLLPGRPQKMARARLVSMKMTAAPVVSLPRKLWPPVAPKIVWLEPAPKVAPHLGALAALQQDDADQGQADENV